MGIVRVRCDADTLNHKCRLCEPSAYLDSSAISASWTCFLSANCDGKSRVMMSWSRTVGLYFLFLKYWEENIKKQSVRIKTFWLLSTAPLLFQTCYSKTNKKKTFKMCTILNSPGHKTKIYWFRIYVLLIIDGIIYFKWNTWLRNQKVLLSCIFMWIC